MINIICEVSKYLVLLFMVLYTVKCFSVLSSKNEEQKRKKLNKQIGYVFVIHFLCYLILYLRLGQLKILIFYVAQIFCSHLVYGALPQHLQGFVQIADKQCIVFAVNRLYYAYASEF